MADRDPAKHIGVRAGTDLKKEQATPSAGPRLIRWHVKSLPEHDAIRAVFAPRAIALAGEGPGRLPQLPDGDAA